MERSEKTKEGMKKKNASDTLCTWQLLLLLGVVGDRSSLPAA
jgi:hypothetical protein